MVKELKVVGVRVADRERALRRPVGDPHDRDNRPVMRRPIRARDLFDAAIVPLHLDRFVVALHRPGLAVVEVLGRVGRVDLDPVRGELARLANLIFDNLYEASDKYKS